MIINQNATITNSIKFKSIEIVGLNYGSDGRMCGMNPTNCGIQVQVGMHLKLRKGTVDMPLITKVPVKQNLQEQ